MTGRERNLKKGGRRQGGIAQKRAQDMRRREKPEACNIKFSANGNKGASARQELHENGIERGNVTNRGGEEGRGEEGMRINMTGKKQLEMRIGLQQGERR